MAGASSLSPSISKSLSVTQHFQFCSHQKSNFHVNSIRVAPNKPTQLPKFSIESNKLRRVLPIHVIQWGSEPEPEPEPESEPIIEVEGVATAVAEEVVEEEPIIENTENTTLKKALMDALYGTERGLRASSETRAEIIEIISQLEAHNPTPAPTEALQLLDGKWILAYTSYIGLFPLLASGTPPLLKVEEISQIIDSENFTVENSVLFAGLLATTSVSTNAKFEVRSPKRVQIKFEQGVIGTPQLTDSIVLPETIEFLGRDIDLTPFKGLITSIQDTASSVFKNISSHPPFEFPITSDKAQAWLLTTYLDGELRISRGDGGSVFILIKEGSPLLKPYPKVKEEEPENIPIES